MATTDMVVEFLKDQGFRPDIDPDNGNVYFKFQMANFLYINNDEDEDFFQLLMPAIYEVTEDNREFVLEAINKVNSTLKVAKGCILGDQVWIMFENLLDHTPDISDILPRALGILQAARQSFVENLR